MLIEGAVRDTDEDEQYSWLKGLSANCLYGFSLPLREGFKKKRKKKEWINPSGLAGWGQHGSKIQKKIKLLKLLQTT